MACHSSPGGIWILAGSCGGPVWGSRGATGTVCEPAALGTVITTVLPGVVVWFKETTWLKGGLVACDVPLMATPPEGATFATTMTEGEEVRRPGSGAVEVLGWWICPTGRTLDGSETKIPFEEPAAVGGGDTAGTGNHLAGTCNRFT